MPTASRNERKKRRLKRNVSLLSKQNKQLQSQAMQDRFTLFQVLAQLGGCVRIYEDTAKQVVPKFNQLYYRVERATLPGEYFIKLVDALEEKTVTTPAVEVVSVTETQDDGA